MNASTFLEALEEQRMQDTPIYRAYIPDADPAEAAKATATRAKKKLSAADNEETVRQIERVAIGETAHISFIIEGCTTSREAMRFRVVKSGRLEKVGFGVYRRLS